MAVEDPSTITRMSRIAETSVTRDSITVIPAMEASLMAAIMAADSTGLRVFTVARALTADLTFTRSQDRTLARSAAALIMAGRPEAFLRAVIRALAAAASMAVAATAAVDGTR